MICQSPPSRSGAKTQTVAQVGRRDVDRPGVERALHGRAPEDQDGSQQGEKGCRDPEKAHVEGPHPEVEQIAADQRPSADAVLFFEA
jgi:hypothetical protein